jgi:hypothetical protein
MTYTRDAGIYLGDVSSQVCEFVLKPRPCVFANANRASWEGDPEYEMWKLGPAFERIEELPAALERAVKEHERFRSVQEVYVRDSFDLSDGPSSRTRTVGGNSRSIPPRALASSTLTSWPRDANSRASDATAR